MVGRQLDVPEITRMVQLGRHATEVAQHERSLSTAPNGWDLKGNPSPARSVHPTEDVTTAPAAGFGSDRRWGSSRRVIGATYDVADGLTRYLHEEPLLGCYRDLETCLLCYFCEGSLRPAKEPVRPDCSRRVAMVGQVPASWWGGQLNLRGITLSFADASGSCTLGPLGARMTKSAAGIWDAAESSSTNLL
jgi:hypothetical protein